MHFILLHNLWRKPALPVINLSCWPLYHWGDSCKFSLCISPTVRSVWDLYVFTHINYFNSNSPTYIFVQHTPWLVFLSHSIHLSCAALIKKLCIWLMSAVHWKTWLELSPFHLQSAVLYCFALFGLYHLKFCIRLKCILAEQMPMLLLSIHCKRNIGN